MGQLLPRRVGFGAFDLSAAANTGSALVGVDIPTADQVLRMMPPDVQKAVAQGQILAGQAQPAIDVAQTIASGGVPSEMETVTGLAAMATLATGNPLAGAVVIAAGSIVQGVSTGFQALFGALGLYDPPPPSYPCIGFIRSIDTIPYAPIYTPSGFQYDPSWININTFEDLWNFTNYGDSNHPKLSCNNNNFMGAGSLYDLLTKTLYRRMSSADQWKWANGYWDGNSRRLIPYGSPGNQNQSVIPQSVFSDASPFEQFFNTMLLKNLQYWLNGQPYLPIRALLLVSSKVWNSQHYGPCPPEGGTCNARAQSSTCFVPVQNVGFGTSTVEYVLGPNGARVDTKTVVANNSPPLCINTGPANPTVSAKTSATVSKTAAIVVSVPIAAAMGTIAYSVASGMVWDAVLKNLWKSIARRV